MALLHVPAGHAEQLNANTAPGIVLKEPAPHGWHVVMLLAPVASLLHVPAGHAAHDPNDGDPAVDTNVPAGQGAQPAALLLAPPALALP